MMLLTPRQREVLDLLELGMSTADIAGKLWITKATARNHVQQILDKLGVHTRLAAVHAARVWVDSPAQRILDYCQGQRMRLTPWQQQVIRRAFDPYEGELPVEITARHFARWGLTLTQTGSSSRSGEAGDGSYRLP